MVFSNPDLNGSTPLRTQPGVGEWGPSEVITARAKIRHRALTPLVFMTVVMGLLALGTWMFWQVQTGPISEPGQVVVDIGKIVVPIVFVASLVTTLVVWVLGRPYRRLDLS